MEGIDGNVLGLPEPDHVRGRPGRNEDFTGSASANSHCTSEVQQYGSHPQTLPTSRPRVSHSPK